MVATAGIFSFQIAVPGGLKLPCAGISRVTVTSTHRRRGLLTRMMGRQLEDAHQRGEPLAALYASEAVIYGRFGYGVATYGADVEITRARSSFGRQAPAEGRVTLVDKVVGVHLLDQVWNRAQPAQPGMLTHTEAWWRHDLADLESWREGASEQYLAVFEEGPNGIGEPQGFVQYRLKTTWTENQPDGTLTVLMLIAATNDAYAALWRHCLDVDLMARVQAPARRVDEPLRFLLADPRALQARAYDGLWLRLIDVPAALAGRRYRRAGTLVLDVRDGVCPWNHRRWELEASDAGATCSATGRPADLVVEVADLAAVYLGGNRLGTLAEAGRVEEARPGALARADAMFASERTPWCPSHF